MKRWLTRWDFKQGPANDFFDRAAVIDGTGAPLAGTNLGATKEAGEPAHGGDPGSASVWYKYTAPTEDTLKVEAEALATNSSENLDMLLAA